MVQKYGEGYGVTSIRLLKTSLPSTAVCVISASPQTCLHLSGALLRWAVSHLSTHLPYRMLYISVALAPIPPPYPAPRLDHQCLHHDQAIDPVFASMYSHLHACFYALGTILARGGRWDYRRESCVAWGGQPRLCMSFRREGGGSVVHAHMLKVLLMVGMPAL